jgi:hypothetical protein
MVQKLGWWGGIMVQSRIDSRDQTPKLMEMNPRIGLVLWYRIAVGINEPLMILKIARGEEVEPIRKYPVETIFVDPLEHAVNVGLGLADLLIHRFRIGILRKEPIDRSHPPISLSELIRSVKSTYFSEGPRVCDLYTKYFFQDPLVSLVWWLQRLTHRWIQNRPRALGR